MGSKSGRPCNDYDGNPIHDRVRTAVVLLGLHQPRLGVGGIIRAIRKEVPGIDNLLDVPLTKNMVHRYFQNYGDILKTPLSELLKRQIDHLNSEIKSRGEK